MEVTLRELMTALHGMLFGGFFLMAAFGVIAMRHRSMQELQGSELTERGRRWEQIYLIVMVALGWAAVLSGAYMVYPWYRAAVPTGVVDLAAYPQRLLLSNPDTAGWHALGMEWKEHIAWIAPIVMTMVAYVLTKYGGNDNDNRQIKATVLTFALIAFLAAGIAGALGSLIDKAAPIEGGSTINLLQGAK